MINKDITIEQINSFNTNTLTSHIGIEFTNFGENFLEAKMPVDKRTHQPMGLLHGGASAVLIESMGSLGSALCVDLKTQHIVGLEINANHIRSIKSGYVYGRAEIIHEGRTTHIWNVNITDENQRLISTGRLTVLVKKNK